MFRQGRRRQVRQHGPDPAGHLDSVRAVVPDLPDRQVHEIGEAVLQHNEAQGTVPAAQPTAGQVPGTQAAQQIMEHVSGLAGRRRVIGTG